MLAFTPSREAGVREIESLDLCLFLNVPLPSTGSVVGGGDGADVGGGGGMSHHLQPRRDADCSDLILDGVPAASVLRIFLLMVITCLFFCLNF